MRLFYLEYLDWFLNNKIFLAHNRNSKFLELLKLAKRFVRDMKHVLI